MKNKLLVSVFAAVVGAFALTSCESKTNVMELCGDMLKETLHKTPRSLVKLDGQKLTIYEYEFLGGVDDNRLVYRTVGFGNGYNQPKTEEIQTFEYGEWGKDNNSYTLNVTPAKGDPYTLIYMGNSLVRPDGLVIGGDLADNTDRVNKWEGVLNTLPNTTWEATFKDKYVMDSIFRDSIRTTFIPPVTFIEDTIKVYTGKMDTLNADTSCYYRIDFTRDAAYKNTTTVYMRSVRSEYNRATGKVDTVSVNEQSADYYWYFSDVSSASKFIISLDNVDPAKEGDDLSITKYKLDDAGLPAEFLLDGMTFKLRP